MSINDSVKLWLEDAQKTHFAGESLAHSLYATSLDIFLRGELGAGKTTFVQGLCQGLGIGATVTSPTYALEQRYATSGGKEFLHLDLYRIARERALELVAQTNDHTGVRCIEWADRLSESLDEHPSIDIHLEEDGAGRVLTVHFRDIAVPSADSILAWRKEFHLPKHVASHCDRVAALAMECAEHLIAEGVIVRRAALEAASLIHDLFRFVDFKPDASPTGFVPDARDESIWEKVRTQYPGQRHEDVCTTFLLEKGYDGIAEIVRVHGLHTPSREKLTIEQKLLYYADKRMMHDRIVSLEERFADLRSRYQNGNVTEDNTRWMNETFAIERDLFPDGPPV